MTTKSLREYDNLTRLLVAYIKAFINRHRNPDLFGLPDLVEAEKAWRRANEFNVAICTEMQRRDELEGDLIVIQRELLPDYKETLAGLTSPDYKPEANADHDLRESDIEDLQRKIVKLEAEEQVIRQRLYV